jgi:hypothetical protein
MREVVLKTPMKDEEIMALVKGAFSAFWTPQFFFRKVKEGLTSWERFRYYVFLAWRYWGKLWEFKE